jgi:hypothetical protein
MVCCGFGDLDFSIALSLESVEWFSRLATMSLSSGTKEVPKYLNSMQKDIRKAIVVNFNALCIFIMGQRTTWYALKKIEGLHRTTRNRHCSVVLRQTGAADTTSEFQKVIKKCSPHFGVQS